jgi:hypothetical protein
MQRYQLVEVGDPPEVEIDLATQQFLAAMEYRYDAGGNRVARRKSEDFGTKKAADYRPVEIIRYNYAYPPDARLSNQDDFYDAREFTGEPDERAAPRDRFLGGPIPGRSGREDSSSDRPKTPVERRAKTHNGR